MKPTYWYLTKAVEETIKNEIQKELDSIHESFSWLQYTRRNGDHFEIVNGKDRQYEVLTRIHGRVADLFPHIPSGQIADLMTVYVNQQSS